MRMGVPWRAGLGPGPSGRTVRLLALLGALALLLSPAAGDCSRALDCAIKRRESCTRGLNGCGSCLPDFIEDEEGNCVQKPSVQKVLLPHLETPYVECSCWFCSDLEMN